MCHEKSAFQTQKEESLSRLSSFLKTTCPWHRPHGVTSIPAGAAGLNTRAASSAGARRGDPGCRSAAPGIPSRVPRPRRPRVYLISSRTARAFPAAGASLFRRPAPSWWLTRLPERGFQELLRVMNALAGKLPERDCAGMLRPGSAFDYRWRELLPLMTRYRKKWALPRRGPATLDRFLTGMD